MYSPNIYIGKIYARALRPSLYNKLGDRWLLIPSTTIDSSSRDTQRNRPVRYLRFSGDTDFANVV